jgi:hypothetical protein
MKLNSPDADRTIRLQKYEVNAEFKDGRVIYGEQSHAGEIVLRLNYISTVQDHECGLVQVTHSRGWCFIPRSEGEMLMDLLAPRNKEIT